MKTIHSIYTLLILFGLSSLSAGARQNSEVAEVDRQQNLGQGGLASEAFLPWDGIYKFQEDTFLVPDTQVVGGKSARNSEDEFMSFFANEPVAAQFLEDGNVSLSTLLQDEERGQMPERIVVSRDKFRKAKLKLIGRGGPQELQSNYSPLQPNQQASGRRGFAGRGRMHSGGYGGCLAYVCAHVGCSGHVGNGVGMTRYLLRQNTGWQRVNCASAPDGAVASWSGGSGGRGHTAIKQNGAWCFDEGCFEPGRGYGGKNCVARGGGGMFASW